VIHRLVRGIANDDHRSQIQAKFLTRFKRPEFGYKPFLINAEIETTNRFNVSQGRGGEKLLSETA
jgi:hypothetical protein